MFPVVVVQSHDFEGRFPAMETPRQSVCSKPRHGENALIEPMHRRLALAFLLAAVTLSAHADKARKPKPALPAAQYALHQTLGKVTVAIEPGDIKDARPDTRLDYFHHGFLPFRIVIQNDSDQPISLDDARIKFISQDSTVVPAATDEELQRRMFSRKSAAGTRVPLPMPLPSITIKHPPVDKQILSDDIDFGFKTTIVAPHTTESGYLFYDVRDLDDPVLEKATMEVREMKFGGKIMESFLIPLKPSPEPPKSAEDQKPADTKKK